MSEFNMDWSCSNVGQYICAVVRAARSTGIVVLRTYVYHQGLVHFEKKVNPMNIITFVLFVKYCPIVDQLGSKNLSRDFQLNCVISYFFIYI